MRGIGLGDWFDAWTGRDSPRRRRKALETKAGDKFDDYLAHPARRAPDHAPPTRAGAFDPHKHRSFDRPKTPRGVISWKRTASAPRALSEVTDVPPLPHAPTRVKGRVSWSPANASRSRSSLSLTRAPPTALARTPTQRFYAPNERPVSKSRPHPTPPPEASSLPAAPPAPSTSTTSLSDVLAEAVISSSNLASLRAAATAGTGTGPAAGQRHHSLSAVQTHRSSLSSTSLTSSVLTEIAPTLALPESSRHRRAQRTPATMQYSASVPSRAMPEANVPEANMPYSASAPVVRTATSEIVPNTTRAAVKKKSRPPPLVTPSIPHGFPAGGFREVRMQTHSASAKTLVGNGRYSPDGPSMQQSVSSPAVHLAGQEHLAAQDSFPRPSPAPVKKKGRPPPLVTPSIPHGFPAGGFREARMQGRAGSAKTLMGGSRYSYDDPPMQHSVSSPSVHLAGQEHVPLQDSLPRPSAGETNVKAETKRKARPPPLVTPSVPHGFPGSGFRESHMPARSGSGKTIVGNGRYSYDDPSMQMQGRSGSAKALGGNGRYSYGDQPVQMHGQPLQMHGHPGPAITPVGNGAYSRGDQPLQVPGHPGSAMGPAGTGRYSHGDQPMQIQARSGSAKTIIGNGRYSYDDPAMQMLAHSASAKTLTANGRYSHGDQPMQMPGRSGSAKTLVGTDRYSYDGPLMQHSVSSPPVHFAGQEHLAAQDSFPQPPTAEPKKKARPPRLVTPSVPHGFPGGGFRESHMPGRSGSAKTLIGDPLKGFHDPQMQHSVSSPSGRLAELEPFPLPSAAEIKKKMRPPPLASSSVPDIFPGGGFRAQARKVPPRMITGNGRSRYNPNAPPVQPVPEPFSRPSAAEIRKMMRPPPLATPAVPHGFSTGGVPRMPERSGSAKGLTEGGSYRYSHEEPRMQHSASSPAVLPITPVTPNAVYNSAVQTLAEVRRKTRPPPLATPGCAHGFASGGLRDATPVPDTQVSASVTPVSPATSYFAGSAEPSASEPSTNGSPERQIHEDRKEITPPRVAFPARRTSSSSTLRFSDRSPSLTSRPFENPESRYDIEEAPSLSSLGDGVDSDTPSVIAAKNGIFPVNQTDRSMRRSLDDVSEDMFLIGADGVFKGGGFVITENGMLQAPGNLTRSHSFGTEVDGAPKSFNNNLIHVRSLAEFARGSTLSRRNKLDSTLGAGAAGRVSLAVHRPSGRKIAVKRINVFDVEKRTQLLKELETLMRYESRFLVRSYGAFYDGEGVVHVTLEYMDRGSLEDVIHLYGRLPEDIVTHIIEHCLLGLMFLHDNHVLHRDFKTGNILLSARVCRAKLSDFGLARDLHPGESRTDSYVGTVAYMSPERLTCGDYTYASDIWGLGICVLECLLGKHPFDKPQSYFDYVDAAKSDPSTLLKGATPDAVDFVRQCTAINPAERPTARNLLSHPWIQRSPESAKLFREWMRQIPGKHGGEGYGEGFSRLQKLRDRADGKR